jgi:hypothetical protein
VAAVQAAGKELLAADASSTGAGVAK